MKKLILAFVVAASAASLFAGTPTVSMARSFGKLSDGRETKVYRIESGNGLILDVADYGGRRVREMIWWHQRFWRRRGAI